MDLTKVDAQRLKDDSRFVNQGDIFFNIPNTHEEKYFNEAIKKGASYIVSQNSHHHIDTLLKSNSVLKCNNVRKVLAETCKEVFSQPNTQVAVTGTNGKSSVCHFIYQMWCQLNLPSAVLGTLGLSSHPQIANNLVSQIGELTTLGTLSFHHALDQLKQNHIDYLAFEASSHGLDQYRCHGAKIKIACFTSFSEEHLDYHHTMEDYLSAKLKLFTEILPHDGVAIINKDMDIFEKICSTIKQKIYTYGSSPDADFYYHDIKQHGFDKTEFTLLYKNRNYTICIPIVGDFQIGNIICALAVQVNLGTPLDDLIHNLSKLTPPPGRLQKIQSNNTRNVFVDFAHTPEALELTLLTLAKNKKDKKLWLVFGCGGDRDPFKRELMGKVAHAYADKIIITDDNPRTEDPSKIRKSIIKQCPYALDIGNRKEAIHFAIKSMQDNDILLIAGKGHERYQIVGTQKQPFDDSAQAYQALLENA